MTMWALLVACAPAAQTPAAAPAANPASGATSIPAAPDLARRAPEDLLTQNGVYYGCKLPSDCQVKDIGNCCGYYPACVNKDSPTFPEQVKADCEKEGRMGVCGFPAIASCDCIESRCTAVSGPSGAAQLQ
jgi:hypothetical protein